MSKIIYVKERSILNIVKKICEKNLKSTDIVVDMTIGNGLDTLFLASIVKKGYIFGFDIQEQALHNTDCLLKEKNITNYKLFLESHENICTNLAKYHHKIKLILFNLGYLPKANKNIMTNHKSTLIAVQNSLKMIKRNGIILIVCYPHEEGKKEAKVLKEYLNQHNIFYTEYRNTSKEFAPFLIRINK